MNADEIDQSIPPSGDGCEECTVSGEWWLHLRRCATCGHVGCCDNSPNQHATRHQEVSGHPVIHSFEPGETWFYDYRSEQFFEGPELAPPEAHPISQGVPGPEGAVPPDWQSKLNP